MPELDLILDGVHTPTFEEIAGYINKPAAILWHEFNSFIQENYKSSPKITFSKCSAKPGWNVKYQKSGKSLCTIYPEKDGFIVLIVITLDLMPVIEAISRELDPSVLDIIESAKPFNGTKWLMIPVSDEASLNSTRELLMLKQATRKTVLTKCR